MNIARLAAVFLLISSPAFAQYDSGWNATGPKPLPCFFNGEAHYPAEEVCVGKGVKQVCGIDGTFGAPVNDQTCTGPASGERSYTTGSAPRGLAYCQLGHVKFAVGAQICTAAGTKQVCRPDGTLGTAQSEPSCSGAIER